MAAFGVPTFLLPAVIVLKWARASRCCSAGGCARPPARSASSACLVFHHDFADKAERSLFFKDLALAVGLLAMAAAADQKRRVEAIPG